MRGSRAVPRAQVHEGPGVAELLDTAGTDRIVILATAVHVVC